MGRPRTGSVRYRAGRGWVAELAGEHLGYAPTEAEAKELVAAALAHDSGKAPDSLRAYGARWIARREIDARKRGKPRAGATEVSRWNTHVATASFYDRPLRSITPKQIQQWVREMENKAATQATYTGPRKRKKVVREQADRTLARNTVANTLQLVKLCFADALVDGHVSSNPAAPVKLGRKKVEQHEGELIDHLSAADIAQLFALPLPPRERAFFALGIYGGLRLGELHGLQWRDIDSKRIMVRRAYDKAVKAERAVRDVPILPPALEAVRAYRASLPAAAIGTALMFPSESGGVHGPSYNMGWTDKLYRRKGVLKMSPGWARKAGVINKSFHVLRHTCGCHLLMGTWKQWCGEMTLQDVSHWLGHSGIEVTQDHYAAFSKDSLTNRVQRVLRGKPSNEGTGELT